MIKYALHCDQNHAFEGWFRNSQDFDDQTAKGHLECPICGSRSIAKSLMAPSVSGTRSQNQETVPAPRPVSGEIQPAEQPASGSGDTATGTPPTSGAASTPTINEKDVKELQTALRAMRQHVVENADYVGDRFAEEARKMHFKETEARGIYGEATKDEVQSLAEDGIDCLPLPSLPEDQN